VTAKLEDVARLAGVSKRTVSNVVREYPHVSPKMRERVQRAIDTLGYAPNLTARRLATGRTNMFALAVPALDAPYFAELAESISELATRRDYRVIIEQTSAGAEAERQAIVGRERGLVDGVIFQPTLLTSLEISKLRGDLPLVLLGEVVPPLALDHVMVDNFAAAMRVTEHLIETGRTRIAFLGHERAYRSNTFSRRLVGYQSALQAHRLPVSPELLIPARDYGAAAGDAAVTAAIEHGLHFDGLVCYDDMSAIGALRALRRAKIRVPEDVGVIGWDDIVFAEYAAPSLSTVRADRSALVGRAVDMLFERIEGYDGPGRHELVPFEVTIRESSS
jgi:DNA-binding LacI/PurR family transcriptional regulator